MTTASASALDWVSAAWAGCVADTNTTEAMASPRARDRTNGTGYGKLGPRSRENLVGRDQALLSGAWKMDARAGPARAAQLPARRVEAGRLVEVVCLRGLHAVGEHEGLAPRAREPEPDLAPGLQVVDVGIEVGGLGARYELGQARDAAFLHGGLDLGTRLAMGAALAAALLRQEDVPLAAQGRQLLVDGAHAPLHVGDSSLELLRVQPRQFGVVWHGRDSTALFERGAHRSGEDVNRGDEEDHREAGQLQEHGGAGCRCLAEPDDPDPHDRVQAEERQQSGYATRVHEMGTREGRDLITSRARPGAGGIRETGRGRTRSSGHRRRRTAGRRRPRRWRAR